MEVKVTWTFPALEALAEIHEYKAEYNKKSADKYVDALFQYTEILKQHPEICAICKNPKLTKRKYRCCNFKDHVIIYKVTDSIVYILSILHSRQNPRDFGRVKG